jgi:hypothetical protein
MVVDSVEAKSRRHDTVDDAPIIKSSFSAVSSSSTGTAKIGTVIPTSSAEVPDTDPDF